MAPEIGLMVSVLLKLEPKAEPKRSDRLLAASEAKLSRLVSVARLKPFSVYGELTVVAAPVPKSM
jgi:hypothetical protein